MDGVQHRPALSCNPMCGFNAIVWKTHFILLVIIWSSGKCLSHPPSYCAFKTVTDSFKWCLQIPWGLVTRKFWGWCSASFLSRPLRLLEVNAFLIEGLLLPISFKWQIRGPAQSPLPCCGQVQEIGESPSIVWPQVCSTWTSEGGMFNSGTSWPMWSCWASSLLLKRLKSLSCCEFTFIFKVVCEDLSKIFLAYQAMLVPLKFSEEAYCSVLYQFKQTNKTLPAAK